MNPADEHPMDREIYEWSARAFTLVRKFLKVHIELHGGKGQLEAGEIFLFNHFARFETFIPQYLILVETGALCRSVGASELFAEKGRFSEYLLDIGVVPNNLPRLLPFLAEEILRGRKVVVFPEGGMVKDRRVVDARGDYSVYSRMAGRRRKHHSGAAILAMALDAFKMAVRQAHHAGDKERLKKWVESLGLESVDALLAAASRPTLVVPANITFYPIRVGENILQKGVELFNKGLSRRHSEELLIEGNILLKDTDMDLRLGEPVRPVWSWWEKKLIARLGAALDSLDDFFRLPLDPGRWSARISAHRMRQRALQLRDVCTDRMYKAVTVNLSHLAARTMMTLVERDLEEVSHATFHKSLYLAVKKAQKNPSIFLHRSLRNPEIYGCLMEDRCTGFIQFLETAISMGLVENKDHTYRLLPKLREERELDEIRRENLLVVYSNEVMPVSDVTRAVKEAMDEVSSLDERVLAQMRFEDELLAHSWNREHFSQPRYQQINRQETATESGVPFLFVAKARRELGVLLVHGLLSSPAEMRPFGERLHQLGYPVLGVRLAGHGTSPWDLKERTWEEWLDSVRRGFEIVSALAPRVCLVGFSTGAALALRLAADRPQRLAGAAAVCAPLKLRNPALALVPLLRGADQLVGQVSAGGALAFYTRESEHPHINYRSVPIRSAHELQRLMEDVEKHLPAVQCPVRVIQGMDDPVVDPKSASLIFRKLGTEKKSLVMVAAERHGIFYENVGRTQERVIEFIKTLGEG